MLSSSVQTESDGPPDAVHSYARLNSVSSSFVTDTPDDETLGP